MSGLTAGRVGSPRRRSLSNQGCIGPNISGVERGVRNPTVVVLEVIATALKVPAWRLLEEAGDDAEA